MTAATGFNREAWGEQRWARPLIPLSALAAARDAERERFKGVVDTERVVVAGWYGPGALKVEMVRALRDALEALAALRALAATGGGA